jgi:WD40 repeat protein
MSSSRARDSAHASRTLTRSADQQCDLFEAAWKAGQRPRAEDYLASVPEPERPTLLRELLLLEIDYRTWAGEPPPSGELLERFPDLDRAWLAGVLPGHAPVTVDLPTQPAPQPAVSADTLIGCRIGPYLIEQRVGSGGMGTVYRALREDDYRQRVAIKVIRPGLDSDEVLHRFQTERQVLAELQHPHIARLFDGGSIADGRPYFVMEYIDGEPLDHYCERRQLSTKERLRLLQAVCAAVQHAHERGVVHRDLKPGNVLVTADGVPKVTDFGLAKRVAGPGGEPGSGPTQSGAVLGTPSYMAPEQAGGKRGEVGAAADVYALGAILYELLTGRPPFLAATAVDTLLQVLTAEPLPPSRLCPKLPRDLETICLKCLHKEPHKRYPSAGALADDLTRFLAGEPIRARPVSPWERLWRWCRRHPAQAAAVALSAVAVVSIVALVVGAVFNAQLRAKQEQTEAALAEAAKYRCQLALERGLGLCERGDVARGMLWLSHSLEIAPEQDNDLSKSIRANLAGWRHQVHSLRAVVTHPGSIRAVAFSPDPEGKLFVTGGHDKMVRLWNTGTGEMVGNPWPHPGRVTAVAFRPDGKVVASGCGDGSVWLWDPATGQPLGEPMRHKDTVTSLAFSRDGEVLLTGSRDRTGRLWDVVTRKPIGQPLEHGGEVSAVAFCPDGETVVTAGEGRAPRLWDQTGTGQFREAPWGHSESDFWIMALAFSPDGKMVLTGSGTGVIRLWDVSSGKSLLPPLKHQHTLWKVAFSPDGRMFATSGTEGVARLWETATGRPLGAPLRHQEAVAALAFHPSGKLVLTAGADRTARLWELNPGQSFSKTLPHMGHVYTAILSPDGKLTLTGSEDKTGRLWDTSSGQLLGELRHQGFTYAVAFSRDGKTLATTSNEKNYTAWLWDTATRRHIAGPLLHKALIWSAAFSPDGKTLLTGSRDKKARLWLVATGKLLHTLEHGADVGWVTFSRDGQVLGTSSDDSTVRLWEAATGKLRRELPHPAGVYRVAFSPVSDLVLTGCEDGKARLWELATGRLLRQLRHHGSVNITAFSPDGQTVLTGSSDWTARLWDVDTGEAIGQPMQHQGPVSWVAFSQDGRTVITSSADGTARLWEAATGKPIGTPLRHDGPVSPVALSPNGHLALTTSMNNAYLWKPPAPLAGDVERLVVWTQAITGLELDADLVARVLDAPTWQQRRQRLEALGGPPGS